jgi:WXXGXW repeat (2 copies)
MKRFLLAATLSFAALTGCASQRYGGYGYAAGGYYAPAPPPAVRAEYYGNPPGPGHVWIKGNWEYRDRYQWRQGYWAKPPHRNARWEEGRWSRDNRGWRYQQGRWR